MLFHGIQRTSDVGVAARVRHGVHHLTYHIHAWRFTYPLASASGLPTHTPACPAPRLSTTSDTFTPPSPHPAPHRPERRPVWRWQVVRQVRSRCRRSPGYWPPRSGVWTEQLTPNRRYQNIQQRPIYRLPLRDVHHGFVRRVGSGPSGISGCYRRTAYAPGYIHGGTELINAIKNIGRWRGYRPEQEYGERMSWRCNTCSFRRPRLHHLLSSLEKSSRA